MSKFGKFDGLEFLKEEQNREARMFNIALAYIYFRKKYPQAESVASALMRAYINKARGQFTPLLGESHLGDLRAHGDAVGGHGLKLQCGEQKEKRVIALCELNDNIVVKFLDAAVDSKTIGGTIWADDGLGDGPPETEEPVREAGKRMAPEERAKKTWGENHVDLKKFARRDVGGKDPITVLKSYIAKEIPELYKPGSAADELLTKIATCIWTFAGLQVNGVRQRQESVLEDSLVRVAKVRDAYVKLKGAKASELASVRLDVLNLLMNALMEWGTTGNDTKFGPSGK